MTTTAPTTAPAYDTEEIQDAGHVDVLIVGAGVAGIGAAHHLRDEFPDRTFVILDAQDNRGGTWWTHRYPGVRSDSDLFTYGYRFKPWRGPSIAAAGEILSYLDEVIDEDEREEDRRVAEAAVIAGFHATVAELAAMRRHEGEVLGQVLTQRVREIAVLAERAEAAPGRRPEAIKARIVEQVAMLLDASDRFDPDRLHQEAILIASKADIREELDRLASHVAQIERLIAGGGPIGRRLDFLAQELNREANTLCSKSNDVELTNIGLELKSVVEQFREQVQNLE